MLALEQGGKMKKMDVVMKKTILLTALVGLGSSCTRPTAEYPVQVQSNGTSMSEIETPPKEMSGVIEYARIQLHGHNLGHGLTGLYGDMPRADGQEFVLGNASFAYPPDSSFSNISSLLNRGPAAVDSCQTIIGPRANAGSVEYVDVGDKITLSGNGIAAELPRDPVIYPRPAGEAWYVGYGAKLMPSLIDYDGGLDNWGTSASLSIAFPGGLPPDYATVGAIPYPLASDATMALPADINDIQINGEAVRAPIHGEEDDLVRFAGPWSEALEITWAADNASEPLTISIRNLGRNPEGEGECSCDEDCGEGFSCTEGQCFGADGSSAHQLGELVCTVADDGSFTISPEDVAQLKKQTELESWVGSILIISRITEGELEIPDILTFNGKRMKTEPVRTRAIDAVYTRLEKAE